MRVFNRYFSVYDLFLLSVDIALVFLTTGALRVGLSLVDSSHDIQQWSLWTLQGGMMTLLVVLSFYLSNLYAIDQTLSVRELTLRLMNGFGAACVVAGVVTYLIPALGFETIYLGEMVLMGLGLFAWRIGFMRVLKRARIHARVLIVGTQGIGRLVAEVLAKQKQLGMEVVGFIGSRVDHLALSYGNPKKISLPIFPPQSILALVEQRGVTRILVAAPENCAEFPAQELVMLRLRGIPIEDCHSFYERLESKIPISDLLPGWIVLSKGFRRDRLIMFTKRIIDVGVSLVGLVLSAPISLLTVIAIKLDSAGPILYRQERVGQNERRFTLYKFRSMHEDAEADLGPVWASENDPRITRVGRIIRKLRIDEIPQMINVVKGEMSFVGPRPERPFFVARLKEKIPYYYLRFSVKPGITGWAQISYPYGDSEEGAIEKLQYDLYYIKNISALFDLQIILESFKVILSGKGAR